MSLSASGPFRSDFALLLESAQKLANWIAQQQDGIEIKSSNSSQMPGLFFDLAIEHHVGIVQLVTARIYGSAFALLRPQFEAIVRGIWFQLCATQSEINRFIAKDELDLNTGEMLLAIEQKPDFGEQIFSNLKKKSWNAMNGYTHGGMHQVARRVDNNIIEPNYDTEEVIEVLKASGFFGLMGLLQIARLSGDIKLSNEVQNMIASK